MKPSFALNLTEEGVTLLHRTARGWLDVGHAAFSEPDLTAALEYMRSTALGLSPKGITAKLIIPNSQILYLDLEAPGPDRDSQREQILSALEGRTPYAVSDLVFDWSGAGPMVRVAVVARETLDEAEAFAAEHRFNPVSFVAAPDDEFEGEPFFGPSSLAPSILPKGQSVQRDTAPVTVVARDVPKAEAEAEVAAEVSPEAAPAPVAQDEAPATIAEEPEEPTPEPEAEPQSDPLPEPEPEPLPEPAPEPEPLPEPEPMPIPAPWPEFDPPAPAEAAPPPFAEPAPPPYQPPAFDPPELPVRAQQAPAPAPEVAKPAAAPEEAPMAVDVPVEDDTPARPAAAARSAGVASAVAPPFDDVPPMPSSAALVAFASRRAADLPPAAGKAVGGAEPVSRMNGASTAPQITAGTLQNGVAARPAPATGAKPVVERPAAARPAPKFSYDDPVPPPQRMPGDPPVTPSATSGMMGKAGKGLRNLGTLVTAPSIPGTKKKKSILPPSAPAAAAATLAAQPVVAEMRAAAVSRPNQTPKPAHRSDTLGRGIGTRAMVQKGKPRYLGLILTGLLLLILALVAAWSSFYLARDTTTTETEQVAAIADPAASDVPGPDDEMLADMQDPAEFAAAGAGEVTAPDAIDPALPAEPDVTEPDVEVAASEAALPEAPAPQPEAEVASAEPVVAEPAVPEPVAAAPEPAPQTGVETEAASAAQPRPEGQDEIFLAGMDAPPALSDPLVLTRPSTAADALPAPQMPPPPFGTVYQFDDLGRIIPTPEGIMTPEGVLLVAGKPPRVPPPRPESITQAAAAATAAPVADPAAAVAGAATDGSLSPAETFAADPALSSARPRVRPEGLAPAAPAGGEDDASLAPAEDSRFASLRPRLRPQEILAAGEEARRASEAASLATQAAAAAAVAEAVIADANLSPMAVSVSRVPAPRPRNLSRAVEAAVAAASRQPAARTPEPEPEPAAEPSRRPSTEEEADAEPEVASAAPRIPTRATVAKQATFVNAINLSKINLIGVYGPQSKRYALVRQANGRYKKVRVGDNIDGGRVQAITASEVRYQKGGRLVTLGMPKG